MKNDHLTYEQGLYKMIDTSINNHYINQWSVYFQLNRYIAGNLYPTNMVDKSLSLLFNALDL